jgi:hypothetical protein
MVRVSRQTRTLARAKRAGQGLLVLTALVAPSAATALDHFKCYKLKQNTVTFTPQQVTLVHRHNKANGVTVPATPFPTGYALRASPAGTREEAPCPWP